MKTIVLSAAVLILAAAGPARAQDAAAGEKAFAKCRACHEVGEDAANATGPKLNGLFGRRAGAIAEYNYSDANRNSGVTWNEAIFARYIRDPKGTMPGTKMAFFGIRND